MNRVVLVTGASRGIGRAIAIELHNRGHTVYGTSRNPSDEDWSMLKLDVTREGEPESAVNTVIDAEGRLDVLVNNAGNAVVGPLAEMDISDLRTQFDTNVFGAHRMVRAALPHLRDHDSYIVNIGSFGGRLAIPYQVPYSMSKAALAMYSDGLRMELAKTPVRVSLIEPGDTKTDFHSGRIWASRSEEAEAAVEIMRESESKGADPARIGNLVAKIIRKRKPRARYLTGSDSLLFAPLLRLFPPSVRQWLVMKIYGL